MSGIKALRKIQLGRETTPGTAVAATTIWRGLGAIEDTREVVVPEENVGLIAPTTRVYVPKLGASLELDSVEATFEQLPHILEMGISTVTPVADGSGSGKIYTYSFPTTAAPTVKTYTIEGGDNQAVERMEYTFCSEFTLEGNAGEAWMMGAALLGRQVSTTSGFSSATLPVVEEILFSKTKLYIDDVTGSFGSTEVSDTLLSATLTYTTGLTPKYTASGELYFTFVYMNKPEVVLKLTFEHNASAVSEKANWRSGTGRLIQLKALGSVLTTAGANYSNKTLIINLAGKWRKFDALSDQDGNSIVDAEFVGGYDATAAKFGEIVIVNELSSLP